MTKHHTIKPRIIKVKLLEEVDRQQRAQINQAPPPNPITPAQGKITTLDDYWTIPNVNYRGETHDYDLAKLLLENRAQHTQSEWSAHYQTAKPRGEFHAPDFPLMYSILKAIRAQNGEEAKQFIKKTARENWLMTLTRIAYQPEGLDTIIHNYGTSDEYKESVDFITPDELIKGTQKPKSYQVLLGTKDSVSEINSVFNWLNATDAYAFKLNSKPETLVECVAGFVANSGGAGLDCDGDPTYRVTELGVRRKKI